MLIDPHSLGAGCPLERFVANALLFDDALIDRKPEGEVRLTSLAPRRGKAGTLGERL
jgi:tRNA(Met) cytidine acetyltransferase